MSTNNREEYDKIANEIFFPIYEVLAKDALKISGHTMGECLDVGSGGGHFGLSVAQQSEMNITLMDLNENALDIAAQRIKDWSLTGRAGTLASDVRKIDCGDNRFNLIVSRGSIGFWGNREDMKRAFAEIYRVLAPGGATYIGKGFGNAELAAEIKVKMKLRNPDWPDCVRRATNEFGSKDYAQFCAELGIKADIIDDECGIWVIMKKQK